MIGKKRRLTSSRIQSMIDCCIGLQENNITETELVESGFDSQLQSNEKASSSNHTITSSINQKEESFESNNLTEMINIICSSLSPLPQHSPISVVSSSEEMYAPQEPSVFNRTSNLTPLDFFSSDDSVIDSNYCPSTSDSEDSDKENSKTNKKSKSAPKKSNDNLKFTVAAEIHYDQPMESHSLTSIVLQPEPKNSPLSNIDNESHFQQNNNDTTHAIECQDTAVQMSSMIQPVSNLLNENISNMQHNDFVDTDPTRPETGETSTSETVAKKRKRYEKTLKDRMIEKKVEKRESYYVKQGCDDKCYKKCSPKFTAEERDIINNTYWNLSWAERRLFIQTSCATAIPKRKYTSEAQRKPRRTFSLKKIDSIKIDVCKHFFLTTLGYNKNNDYILSAVNEGEFVDKRGLHSKTPAKNRILLNNHVESFHPQAPHHRRGHAPNRRYLPGDVNVVFMHKDYLEKHPLEKVSYELYRKHVKSMNISFTKLGNEECEKCEANELHCKQASHNPKINLPEDCEDCQSWIMHHSNYTKSRKLYEQHKTEQQHENTLYYSTDMQKVIMLPRLDGFKKILFCPRLTTYNQSFAPVGKITNEHKPLAVLWHDGISSRKQEDVMSAYYYFFMQHRNVKHIHLWMDNCSSQNKNWLLFSLMIHLVNSNLIATEMITFCYFEPGHTFMSCDQFHHQVEKSMKFKGKLYDYQDFEEAVALANKSRVSVKSMTHEDFFKLPNLVSERRLVNTSPRVYLKDLVQILFKRESFDLFYKKDFDEDYQTLRLMTDKYLKNPGVLECQFMTEPKGIEQSRKNAIITALNDIAPTHKMIFWQNMPVTLAVSNKKKSRVTL